MKKQSVKLPSNYRTITDTLQAKRVFVKVQVLFSEQFDFFLLVVASTIIMVLLSHAFGQLQIQLRQNTLVQQERKSIERQLMYWKKIAVQYPGYRDAYIVLADLAYRVGDFTNASLYVKKAQALDPNSESVAKLNNVLKR